MSSYSHHSNPVLSGYSWAGTTVVDDRNLVAKLWGHPLGKSWPPEPTSSFLSIDFWCPNVPDPATKASWMEVRHVEGWWYQNKLANCHELLELTCGSLSTESRKFNVKTGDHGREVERRVPEMRRKVEFSGTSPNPVWGDREQTGAQYSATELQKTTADVWMVSALTPQLEPASFISRLFLFFNFPAVFVRCYLKDSVWSSVTPR